VATSHPSPICFAWRLFARHQTLLAEILKTELDPLMEKQNVEDIYLAILSTTAKLDDTGWERGALLFTLVVVARNLPNTPFP